LGSFSFPKAFGRQSCKAQQPIIRARWLHYNELEIAFFDTLVLATDGFTFGGFYV
jgi:hypothetical protein